jgi:hypothetical protein
MSTSAARGASSRSMCATNLWGSRHAHRAAIAPLQLGHHELGLVFLGIGDGRKGGRRQHLADPAMDLVIAAELAPSAARAHVDDRHEIIGVKDHRLGIAVGGGMIGEPFDIAAEPVVVALHDQRGDAARRHGLAHRRPAAIELGIDAG